MEPIKKDEECFVHYGYRDPRYTLKIAPKWYQALHEKFVKTQPTNNSEKPIRIFQNFRNFPKKDPILSELIKQNTAP